MAGNFKNSGRIQTRNASGIDWLLLTVTFILVVFGLVMVYSASSYTAQLTTDSPATFAIAQLKNAVIGAVVLIIFAIIPVKIWRKVSWIIYGVSLALVFLVLSPIGITESGASRWINLGFTTLQPAELVKLALMFALAGFICKFRRKIDKLIIYFGCVAVIFLPLGIVAVVTRDLGTAMIIFAIGFVMLVCACAKGTYIAVTVGLIAAAGVALVFAAGYRVVRILAWQDIEAYADDEGFQIMQGLYAIGSGGLFGKGLGKSTQKLSFIPESENDMIFSVIVEELGIIGGIILIVLFALMLWRFKKIYDGTDDLFSKLIVSGIAAHICTQAALNMCVVTNLLPNTGVPLPFISYGGSSLIILMAEIGIVMSICRQNARMREMASRGYRGRGEGDVIVYRKPHVKLG